MTTSRSSHQRPARAIPLEINRNATKSVGRIIKATPAPITCGPLSAFRSIPGGGVRVDMTGNLHVCGS